MSSCSVLEEDQLVTVQFGFALAAPTLAGISACLPGLRSPLIGRNLEAAANRN